MDNLFDVSSRQKRTLLPHTKGPLVDRFGVEAGTSDVPHSVHMLEQLLQSMSQYNPALTVLLEHGMWMRKEADAFAVRKAPPKQCFRNALACDVGELFAGYVLLDIAPVPISHAWNAVRLNDETHPHFRVVDITLESNEGAWYYGLRIPRTLARELRDADTPGGDDYLDAIRFLRSSERKNQVLQELRVAQPIVKLIQ